MQVQVENNDGPFKFKAPGFLTKDSVVPSIFKESEVFKTTDLKFSYKKNAYTYTLIFQDTICYAVIENNCKDKECNNPDRLEYFLS